VRAVEASPILESSVGTNIVHIASSPSKIPNEAGTSQKLRDKVEQIFWKGRTTTATARDSLLCVRLGSYLLGLIFLDILLRFVAFVRITDA